MKILWCAWKDRKHPLAGGAEVVSHEIAKRLVLSGHEVIFVVASFVGAKDEEYCDGYKIIRVGNRWTVYFHAYRYYKKHLQGWADQVIDEMNTIPFFVKYYVQEKNILFVHQLCRKIWFYQMFFPLNCIGYVIEPLYLWLLRDREVITVSESTKRELLSFGFSDKKIHIISEGIEINPIETLETSQKYENPSILSFGSLRPMKRTLDIVKAFELVKDEFPMVQLILAGDTSGTYGQKVVRYIQKSKYHSAITLCGKVSKEKKLELMGKAQFLCVSSVKEGWGLVVTEANSQGTPALVYDVDGLRDSVRHNETGIVVSSNTPKCLAENILELLKNVEKYERIRKNAYEWSKSITFEQSFKDFLKVIENIKKL